MQVTKKKVNNVIPLSHSVSSHLLTKKPEDSGYGIECSLIELDNAVSYANSDMM